MKKPRETGVIDVSDPLFQALSEMSPQQMREMLRRDLERYKACPLRRQTNRKVAALGMSEERNLEGDSEIVIGKPGPLPPNAKWPFPKAPSSVQSPPSDSADE